MRSRDLVLAAAVAALVAVGCGDDADEADDAVVRTERSVAVAPSMTVTDGVLVRGTRVTVRLDGLTLPVGAAADLTVETGSEVSVAGRDIVAYAGVASATVGPDGTATATFDVPNHLSGEDDIVPIEPGGEHVLTVRAGDAHDQIPFGVLAATPGTTYAVVARRGSPECGAPPLEVDFDGAMWTPDDLAPFDEATPSFAGTFTPGADGTARFVAEDGTPSTFTRAASGYSC